MSVLFKDMDMPKGCGCCPCSIYGDCDAVKPRKPLTKEYRWSSDKRPDWCPAEEQEQRWIKIKRKQLTPWSYVMDCKLPDNKQEVLVSDGQSFWIDTFNKDPEGLSFRYGGTKIETLWWMPLPEPPKEDN